MKRIALVAALALSGCATVNPVLQSPNTFIACKAADILTTKVALNSGKFVEINPILKTLIGPHNFIPLIAFSIIVYEILVHVHSPIATEVANVATCGVAAHNAILLHGAGIMH